MTTKALWFLVKSQNNSVVTFFVNDHQIVISPYIFVRERDAVAAARHDVWPKQVSDQIVARPGPPEKFLAALRAGFPNTRAKSKPPDVLALNGSPGQLLSGLIPLTSAGAAFVDRLGGTSFWTELDQHGYLVRHAIEAVNLALGRTTMS